MSVSAIRAIDVHCDTEGCDAGDLVDPPLEDALATFRAQGWTFTTARAPLEPGQPSRLAHCPDHRPARGRPAGGTDASD